MINEISFVSDRPHWSIYQKLTPVVIYLMIVLAGALLILANMPEPVPEQEITSTNSLTFSDDDAGTIIITSSSGGMPITIDDVSGITITTTDGGIGPWSGQDKKDE